MAWFTDGPFLKLRHLLPSLCHFYDVNWGSKGSTGSEYQQIGKRLMKKIKSVSVPKNPYGSIPNLIYMQWNRAASPRYTEHSDVSRALTRRLVPEVDEPDGLQAQQVQGAVHVQRTHLDPPPQGEEALNATLHATMIHYRFLGRMLVC